MSTISTAQEAYEALCAGEYFQVGTDIIDPENIVRFDYNDGVDPIFYLSDGATVQHSKYVDGSCGDLLASALQVASRGEAQSETLNTAPTWTTSTNYTYKKK